MKISAVRALSQLSNKLTDTQQRQRERFADVFARIDAEERLQAEQEVEKARQAGTLLSEGEFYALNQGPTNPEVDT